MKKIKIKQLMCILSAVVFVLVCFAACGGKDDAQSITYKIEDGELVVELNEELPAGGESRLGICPAGEYKTEGEAGKAYINFAYAESADSRTFKIPLANLPVGEYRLVYCEADDDGKSSVIFQYPLTLRFATEEENAGKTATADGTETTKKGTGDVTPEGKNIVVEIELENNKKEKAVGVSVEYNAEPTETTKPATPETSEKVTEKVTEKTTEAETEWETEYTPPATEAPKPTEVPKPTEAPKPTEPQTTESKKELEIKMTKQGIIATYGSMDAYYEHIEEVANDKCNLCGDHNCPSLEYHRNALGDIDGYSVFPERCPAIIAGTAKCSHCGKILSRDEQVVDSQPDKYCFGNCYYTIE